MGDRPAKDALFDAFAEVAKALGSGRRAEIVDVLAQTIVDAERLRAEVREKYRAVAGIPPSTTTSTPGGASPPASAMTPPVDALPDVAVESFAGVANPFALRTLPAGDRLPGRQAASVIRP